MINEEFNRSLEYSQTRALVESYVRKALMEKVLSEKKEIKSTKLSQVQQGLSDPTVNKSALAREIEGLSGDDDARRSEISKIARGDWEPSVKIQNDILHKLASD